MQSFAEKLHFIGSEGGMQTQGVKPLQKKKSIVLSVTDYSNLSLGKRLYNCGELC